MIGQVPVGEEGELTSRTCLVFRERHIGLEEALSIYFAVHILGVAYVLAEDAKFGAGVFHR